jgi:hypothetical protein
MESEGSLEEQVIAVLKRFSGRREIGIDQMIGRDVGIYGGDGVEILYELEELFGVDLAPLMREEAYYLPPRWIDRFLGREQGPPNVDLTVRRLIDFIGANRDEK